MLKQIVIGVQAYFNAFALLSKLKLWKYFAIPIIISIITASAIFVSAYGLSDNVGALFSKLWVWEWGKAAFTNISTFLGGIIIVALGIVLYKHIVMALVAPFMSPVSEKIELHLLGKVHQHRNTSFAEQLWRGIRLNIRNLVMELCLTIPILILKVIPVINIFSTALLFLVQAYYAGFGNMDYTLERHYGYKESIQFVRRNRGVAIGNGIPFLVLLFVPIIGVILVLPYSVTAATLRTVEQLQAEELV